MTKFRRRMLETGRELSFEASRMAMDSAGMEIKDVESVVLGTAPGASFVAYTEFAYIEMSS